MNITMYIDDFDAKILAELQSDSDLTDEELGNRVGLTGSAAGKRRKKLKACGLIERHVAVLNIGLIGPTITVLVVCGFDPDGPLVREEFSELVRSRPGVTNVFVLMGDGQVALLLMTRTIEECATAIRALQEEYPQLKEVKESIVTAQPKRSLAVPFSLSGLTLAA